MAPKPSSRKQTIVLAAVTLRGTIWSFFRRPTNASAQGKKRRASAWDITPAVAAAVVMLSLGPALAANASTNPTQAHTHSRAVRNTVYDLTEVALPVARQSQGLVAMHNQLLGTNPPDHAHVATGPARVSLLFDLPAQRGLSTIIVTGPDGHQWQAGPATEQAATVTAPLRPLGPAGNYTVAWRIISADGHPVRGTFQFTLTTPGTGTPATDRTTSTDPASAGTPVWPWLAGAGAVVIAAGMLALRARHTRRG
jgi:methionine-rich copper-binding protein CopC